MNQRSSRLAIAVIIAVALGGSGFVLLLWFLGGVRPQEPAPGAGTGEQTVSVPPPQPEPDLVRAVRGTVTANDDTGQRLTVATPWGARTVLYTEETTFRQTRSPSREERSKLSPEELAAALASEAPLSRRIATGDTIIASSGENISGKTEFLANKITLVIKE